MAETLTWSGNSADLTDVAVISETYENAFTSSTSYTGNTINVTEVTSGTYPSYVIGGVDDSGSAVSGNTVNITGSNIIIGNRVYGGRGTGIVEGNTVVISGATLQSRVHGGRSNYGDTISNKVILKDGATVVQNVFGSRADNANATDNSVIINNATVTATVYGSYAQLDTTGNSVTFTAGSVTGNIYGAQSVTGTSTDNTVLMTGGTVGANVYGGRTGVSSSTSDNETTEDANNNVVDISGGTVTGSAYGGWSSGTGNATGNTVTIESSASIGREVYGGYSALGNANNNSVYIIGGSVTGNIRGGWSEAGSEAANNTVTITGAPTLTGSLYGGVVSNTTGSTGNTLRLWDYQGTSSLSTIDYFQNYEFIVPNWVESTGVYLSSSFLNLNGTSYDAETLVTSVSFSGGAVVASPNSKIYLIQASTTGTLDNANTGEVFVTRKGSTLLYNYQLMQDTTGIYLLITGAQGNPQAKSLVEGRTATLALVNEGSDHLMTNGISSATDAVRNKDGGWDQPAFFSSVRGNNSRYKTGSHIDVKSTSFLAGLAWKHYISNGKLVTGLAFESGYGDFSGHNSVANYNAIHSNGHGYYVGGGLLAKYSHPSGWYAEATLRAGKSRTSFNAKYTDDSGMRPSWKASSPYYAAHTGGGYVWRIDRKSSLDTYSKYLWSHLKKKNSTFSTGDYVQFDRADSQRWLNGTRYNYRFVKGVSAYIGAAYEYEFDGRTRASMGGYSFGAPTLKGGTGIGEVGVNWKKDNISVDVSTQGYVGRRDGVGGNLQLTYNF